MTAIWNVAIVRKDIREFTPQRVWDRAQQLGDFHARVIVLSGRGCRFLFGSQRTAEQAADRWSRANASIADNYRAMIWMQGRANEPAIIMPV